jgi:hypothetical protein
MKSLAFAIVMLALATSGCDDSCDSTPDNGCAVEAASEQACYALDPCQAGPTCCWCEDGEWKRIQFDCFRDAGGSADAAVDASTPDAP